MIRLHGKIAELTALALIAAYVASYATARDPIANAICVGLIVGIAAVVYARSFTWGTAMVLAELVGGSLGRLFVLPGGDGLASVRMGLFAVALLGTAWHIIRHEERRNWIVKRLRGNVGVIVFACLLLIALARGLWQFPIASVIADANAYAFLLLLPTILLVCREEADRSRVLSVVFGAAAAVSLLSLVVLFLFTHGVSSTVASPLYKWVRDFGLGEATPMATGFVRVFFQAHIWTMIVALWSVVLLTCARSTTPRWIWVIGVLSAGTVALSFSRTLWIATLVGILVFGFLLALRRKTRSMVPRLLLVCVVVVSLGAVLPFLVTRGAGGLALQRATTMTGEPAADSRLNLLKVMWPAIQEHVVLGWGFGKSLTYETRDPRLLAYFPDGRYTTTAFEWGWLDFWLKLGIVGLLTMLLWVTSLFFNATQLFRDSNEMAWPAAFAASTVAIAVAHVFSPWLNHPLGFGYLMLVTAIVDRLQRAWINQKNRSETSASPATIL